MQSFDLGDLRCTYRPVTWRIWLLSFLALGPLGLIGLGILVAINDLRQGRSFSGLAGPLGCLGVVGLLLALLIGFLIGELRKWLPTRTARLKIYELGFTYQEHEQIQVCRWNEIRDITHRRITIQGKGSPPRRVNVIRSIIKQDGTVISLAESLNLLKLTPLLSAQKKAGR